MGAPEIAGLIGSKTTDKELIDEDTAGDGQQTTSPLLGDASMASGVVAPDVVGAALGDFGRWQLRTFLLVALVKVPSAWQMASILFTAPTPAPGDVWCVAPSGVQATADACRVYPVDGARANSTDVGSVDVGVPGNLSVPCTRFQYTTDEHTVVFQWDLVCDRRILASVSQFFYLFGILAGGFMCARLLPRVGPRRLMLAGMLAQIGAGVGVAFAPFFELHVALRCLTAAACATMFSAAYVICTDACGGRSRLVVACLYEHFWSLGVILLAVIASQLSDWQHLQLALSLPTLLVLAAYWWIPESPRWLLKSGDITGAKFVLENASKFNGKPVTVNIPPQLPPKSDPGASASWIDLFRWAHLTRSVAMHVAWAATVVTYYGALLNVRNLGGSVLVNTGIAGVAEIVGVLLGLVLILWTTKKWLYLAIVLLVGGSACCLGWVLPSEDQFPDRHWALLGLAMTGRVAIACSLTVLHVTSAEILPPELRLDGVLSSVTFARIWLLTAPFIGYLAMYGDSVSLSSFGAITILGGVATLHIALTTPTPFDRCPDPPPDIGVSAPI